MRPFARALRLAEEFPRQRLAAVRGGVVRGTGSSGSV